MNKTDPSKTMTTKKKNHDPRHGSFYITSSDILTLLNNSVPAIDIFALMLILRCKRKHSSCTSSASYSLLRRNLGIGTIKANKILERLQYYSHNNNYLIHHIPYSYCYLKYDETYNSINEYHEYLSELTRFHKHKRNIPRWRIHIDLDKSAWFNNSIIENTNDTDRIKKSIFQINDNAIRLLLLLHQRNNTLYDAVDIRSLRIGYKREYLFSEKGLNFYYCSKYDKVSVGDYYIGNLFNVNEIAPADSLIYTDKIDKLLHDLEFLGYLSRVVIAVMYDPDSTEPTNYFEIDIKNSSSQEKRSCHALAKRMKKIAHDRGFPVGRNDARFYDKYVVAIPEAAKKFVVYEAFRLSYSVRNPNNKGVKKGIAMRESCLKEIIGKLECIEICEDR